MLSIITFFLLLNTVKCHVETESFPIILQERKIAWNFAGLFHFTNKGKFIEGPIEVAVDSSELWPTEVSAMSPENTPRRTGLFDFSNKHLWTHLPGKQTKWIDTFKTKFRYSHSCTWCERLGTRECSKGGVLTATISPGDTGPMINMHAALIRSRPYSFNRTEFRPLFRSIVLKCDFSNTKNFPIAKARKGYGFMHLSGPPSAAGFSPMVNRLYDFSKEQVVEDVICNKAFFGEVDPDALVRFAEFYLGRFKFTRLVFYHVGLVTNMDRLKRNDKLRELIKSGQFLLIDVQRELRRLYGTEWRDVVFFSKSTLQMNFMADCVIRSKAFGVRWAFFVDLDEWLFESKNPTFNLPSFQAYIDQHIPDNSQLRYLSIPIEPVSKRDPLCECTQGPFDFEEFVVDTHLKHQVAIKNTPGFPGVFIHTPDGETKSHFGKRKILLRLNMEQDFDPAKLYVHDVVCGTHMEMFGDDSCPDGRWVDPFNEFYLREYSCMNVPFCFQPLPAWYN